MTRDEEYMLRRTQEKIRQNIIKWWNVKDLGTKNYIGSPDLEDSFYGCHVYEAIKEEIDELSTQDHLDNVDYRDPVSESSEEPVGNAKDEEAVRIANEIYLRLQREAEEDEKKKQEEIEAAKQANATDANFNASTGSYSGLYGQTPMSAEEQDAFNAIMAQNNNISESASALFQTPK